MNAPRSWTRASASIALALVGCSPSATAPARGDAATPVRVQTTLAQQRDTPETRVFFATLTPERQASVAPLVSGRVEQRFVERGDRVRAGDPLFRLRDGDYRDQSAQAAAVLGQALSRGGDSPEVRSAQANVTALEENLRRVELLASQGSASAQELTRARTELTAARSQLTLAEQGSRSARFATAQARAQLSASQRAVRETIVRAPFDGEVIERRAEVGDFAPAGAPIVTVLRRDSLRARFDAGQADSFALRPGLRATVTVDGLDGAPMRAQLRYLSPASSESARATTVEAAIDNADPRARPGQLATVRVELEQTQRRVAVDRRALRSIAGVFRAFVLRDRRAHERVLFIPEEPEDSTATEVLVARGLAHGETVVLDPPDSLVDGQEVTQ
ncbi:MAG: efflux RND transporter periplasmic adaptor subunit [Polyangiales bacterium]